MRKIVFSGGTHCGKTTLIEHYKSLGLTIVAEPGMTFISELVQEMGLETYKKWREENKQEFFDRLVVRQLELENDVPYGAECVFFDRSIVDTIAMAIYSGVEVPVLAINYVKENRYDDIFICELLPHFEARITSGRVFTLEDSKNIAKLVSDTYTVHGYETFALPAVSVDERISIINKQIGFPR